ncbi:DUF6851 domain-containing protein [Saccharothrix sp. S26]|uniref:DUF6851 domain-containing protein n=1 Tax=Saccharothrix sp. S26 TaxID=2907215 RepID=UPI0035ABD2CE
MLTSRLPQLRAQGRDVFVSAGLDPDDDSRDTTTAAGTGNSAGRAVIASGSSTLHSGASLGRTRSATPTSSTRRSTGRRRTTPTTRRPRRR